MTVLDAIRSHSNDGSAHSTEPSTVNPPIPSSGLQARGWIQAPITRVSFASVAARPVEHNGPYATSAAALNDSAAKNELAELQLAAAASFWAVEDSLPEN